MGNIFQHKCILLPVHNHRLQTGGNKLLNQYNSLQLKIKDVQTLGTNNEQYGAYTR